MAIITFWNDCREQSGKTLTAVAFATQTAIKHNSKVLLISTSIADNTMQNCFFMKEATRNFNLFNNGRDDNIVVENGVEGLMKLVSSNKLTSSTITDYTRVVFKDRLEIVLGPSGYKNAETVRNIEELKKLENGYMELINLANQYYDIVVVDLDKMLSNETKENILKFSDVNVFVLSQKVESINRYSELKKNNKELLGIKCVPVIGKYMSKYKYNVKNISRYLQEKKTIDTLPLNLLYMQASEEGEVADLFLKLRSVKDKNDENYIFMQSSQDLTSNILKKLQSMQIRMR